MKPAHQELLEAWKEGNSVNRVSELYAAHSREAVKVEKALEIINSTLLAQRERGGNRGRAAWTSWMGEDLYPRPIN